MSGGWELMNGMTPVLVGAALTICCFRAGLTLTLIQIRHIEHLVKQEFRAIIIIIHKYIIYHL